MLKDSTTLLAMEGTIRSVKTTTAIQLIHWLVQDSDKVYHLIGCYDTSAINDVILQSEMGLITLFPEYYQLKKDKIAGFYVEAKCVVKGKPSVKKILLCPFGNKSRWKVINGKEFGVIILDEVNNANKQFVDECFARQANVDHPKVIMTLNGDDPNHYIYQDYINRCVPVGRIPEETMAYFIKDREQREANKGWFYKHFTMNDNPSMTQEKIERTHKLFPVGSYYYKIKVLGLRGKMGKMIFTDYMSEDTHVITEEANLNEYIVGCDIGATGAENSFTLVGFKKDYSEIQIVDNYSFKQCGWEQKKSMMIATVLNWKSKGRNIICVSIDSAEQNYIMDMKKAFAPYGIQVVGSYKATIKERIDLMIILLSLKRIKFLKNQGALGVYNAYLMARWEEGKEGEIREDLNEPLNDKMDSCEYALTVKMKTLLSIAQNEMKGR